MADQRDVLEEALTKVPAITLGFWIIKILATTLGETGGDTVTMSWLGETTDHPVPYGYLIGTAIFGAILVALVIAQIRARTFNRGYIGRRSSPRRLAARRSPTSPTGRSGSAIRAGRCCCSPASSSRCSRGGGRWAR